MKTLIEIIFLSIQPQKVIFSPLKIFGTRRKRLSAVTGLKQLSDRRLSQNKAFVYPLPDVLYSLGGGIASTNQI